MGSILPSLPAKREYHGDCRQVRAQGLLLLITAHDLKKEVFQLEHFLPVHLPAFVQNRSPMAPAKEISGGWCGLSFAPPDS